MRIRRCSSALLGTVFLLPALAFAQVTIKNDGKFRALISLDASVASGNTHSSNVSLSFDGVRSTRTDKLSVKAQGLRGRANGETQSERLSADGRYDYDLSVATFGFVGANALRDKPSNLSSRLGGALGMGVHVINNDTTRFDLLGGLGYTYDRYVNPVFIDGAQRQRYGRPELPLTEESTHKLSDTATLRQSLTATPNLRDLGEYRLNFDVGLALAITQTFSLTVSFNYRHDSDPGVGFKRDDTLLLTGIAVRLD